MSNSKAKQKATEGQPPLSTLTDAFATLTTCEEIPFLSIIERLANIPLKRMLWLCSQNATITDNLAESDCDELISQYRVNVCKSKYNEVF